MKLFLQDKEKIEADAAKLIQALSVQQDVEADIVNQQIQIALMFTTYNAGKMEALGEAFGQQGPQLFAIVQMSEGWIGQIRKILEKFVHLDRIYKEIICNKKFSDTSKNSTEISTTLKCQLKEKLELPNELKEKTQTARLKQNGSKPHKEH